MFLPCSCRTGHLTGLAITKKENLLEDVDNIRTDAGVFFLYILISACIPSRSGAIYLAHTPPSLEFDPSYAISIDSSAQQFSLA
jgi:hypothetical protein